MTTQELYQSLEFSRIRDEIEKEALSEPGRELVQGLTVLHDSELIRLHLNWVSEMATLLAYDDVFPISEIGDSRGAIRKAAHEGSQLTLEEFSVLYKNLLAVRKISKYLKARIEKFPMLSKFIARLHPFRDLETVINHSIDVDGLSVKDQASSELAAIRKELNHSADRVRKRMASIVESHHEMLQDTVITMREGRMVLPLKEEYRGRIQGLIHDHSATGATLFVEPFEIIEMNNRIRELHLQETREIARILRDLTGLVRVHLFDIEENLEALSMLDFIHAKARFALRLHAQKPEISEKILNIRNGRHPILLLKFEDPQKVVPLNLKMGEDFHILVITGPNAGGKTVALKTVGLLSLMMQSGLLITADEFSLFPVFDQIFVDIGDWQSVDQDLSTFSAHVGRLGEILANATERSLVLIDEIGTGTDPVEGAALAMAFLEKLKEIGCMTVVTTHQGALKAFAYELEGAENGSMTFNEETLLPTYQFRAGIPGSSYAFEIARRIGLPDEMLQKAQTYAGEEKNRLEQFLLDLEKKINHYEELLRKADIKKAELDGMVKLYREKTGKLKEEEQKLKRKAMEESRDIVRRANALIEKTVKEIRTQQAERESIRKAKMGIKALEEEIDRNLKEMTPDIEPTGQPPAKGDSARWIPMGVVGTVVSEPDNSGKVWLEAGEMKLKVDVTQLEKVKAPKKRKSKLSVTGGNLSNGITDEIDLRGMTMDEAEPVLERAIDQVYLAGLTQLRVIHGKGTGALRKKVHDYLRKHPRVAGFSLGNWNEGGTGMTVVELKKN